LIDRSLLTDEPIKEVLAKTLAGQIRVPVFKAPAAYLKSHDLRKHISLVGGIDLRDIRHRSGLEVYGILGMDFLQDWVLQFDFDRKQLSLRNEAMNPVGATSLSIVFDDRGPTISGFIPGWGTIDFLLDSGLISHHSGAFDSRVATKLRAVRSLKDLGTERLQSIAEDEEARLYMVKSFALGGFEVLEPIFGESRNNENRLSLYYFSRYNMTLDFPNRKMYLKQSKAFSKADERNHCGLRLTRSGGNTTVRLVEPDSPAQKAGFCVDDTLTNVQGRPIDRIGMYELEHIFSQVNATIHVVIDRGAKRLDVNLNLNDD
jgi:hypothetical protein